MSVRRGSQLHSRRTVLRGNVHSGEQIQLRKLPEGRQIPVWLRSLEGRIASVEIAAEAEPILSGQAVELANETVVYLGVATQVETSAPRLIWVDLEHRLERSRLAELKASWSGERA